ncbi:MAG TPA: N-acetylmuramoyl-L-alanine amidase-like domain-containing protein [Pseudolabrys sp.]
MLMPLDSSPNRRHVLQILAGGAAYVAGNTQSLAGEARIAVLIEGAQVLPGVAQRVNFIAAALRGTTYRGYTLIGGPQQPEKFVARDDGFDCVTFCETVLAAAKAANLGEFETNLKGIRYHDGVVAWRERNHYFFDWSQHNIENKTCRAVVLDGSVELRKSVYWQRELGHKRFSMTVIPRAVLLANKSKLAAGDIIGFVTARPNLDYFHVGFVAFGKSGELLLRHASLSRHRVLDERMDQFCAVNRVHYVTLLRAEEPEASAVAVKKG